MTSMTDPSNNGEQINDTVPNILWTDMVPGLCVVDGRNNCATHHGIHPVDLAEVRKLLNCPEWCVSEHAGDNPADPVENIMLHFSGERFQGVEVFRTDVPQEGTIGTPALRVAVDLELTTWQQAAELAHAILDGFGYLEGADKP